MGTATATVRVPVSAASYAAAIEGLVRVNQRILRGEIPGEKADHPALYASGVRYKREPRDVWRHIGDVMRAGWGDCEDLAAARVAQLRESGEDPRAYVAVYQSGPRRYHAIVARGDGTTEDPSKKLGMKPRGMSPMGKLEGREMNETKRDRRERAKSLARYCARNFQRQPLGTHGAWIGMGDDPTPGERTVTFDLYRSGQGWSGIVRVPLISLPGRAPMALVAKTSPTRAKAPTKRARVRAKQKTATKAINLATRIARLPAVQAVIPPQARAAMTVLKSPIGKLATKSAGKILSKLF